ncbi:MAG: endonuclease III domain-containing protein [Anaerolineae bacterium]
MNNEADNVERTIWKIHDLLAETYGDPPSRPYPDPVASLVSTIISQNTNDNNRDVAFQRLRDRYATWAEVRDAPTEEVLEAIRPAGLAPTKAPRIQAALERITEERGEITLDFLKEMSLEEARSWLEGIKGVGPKTAAIVLLFAFDRPAFPVDTHVHRVSRRLGLIPEGTSREKAHDILEDLVPEKLYYAFHIELIRHGRQTCVARDPHCEVCPLNDLCAYYQEQIADGIPNENP